MENDNTQDQVKVIDVNTVNTVRSEFKGFLVIRGNDVGEDTLSELKKRLSPHGIGVLGIGLEEDVFFIKV